jgi:hypothetical protein
VRKVLEQRIRLLLLRFVPEHCLPYFWSLLQSSKSYVMGGVVACAMMGAPYSNFHAVVAPTQLDIVVPADVIRPSPDTRWKHFLCSMDFQLCLPCPRPGPYASCVEKVEIYRHRLVIFFFFLFPHLTCTLQVPTRSICLLHSNSSSALKVVLHSPSTAMFKVLTASTLYDFYPSLTAKRIALSISGRLDHCPSMIYCFGMRSYPVNSPLYRDCLQTCPVKFRRTRKLNGISNHRWRIDNSGFLVTGSDGFEMENLFWRLGKRCDNHACDFACRVCSLYDHGGFGD